MLEDGQKLGGPLQGLAGGLEGTFQSCFQGFPLGPLPGRPGHGEDGPLHGAHHRPVTRLRPAAQGLGQGLGVQGLLFPDGLAEAPENLGEDDPAVPPGPEEAPVGDGPGHLGIREVSARSSSRLADWRVRCMLVPVSPSGTG